MRRSIFGVRFGSRNRYVSKPVPTRCCLKTTPGVKMPYAENPNANERSPSTDPSHPANAKRGCFKTGELIFGIIFGIWNNVSTVINANLLYEKGHNLFGFLTLFFLFFPGNQLKSGSCFHGFYFSYFFPSGLVTSIGFLVLHSYGHRRFSGLGKCRVGGYFLLLLFFYPVIPIAL